MLKIFWGVLAGNVLAVSASLVYPKYKKLLHVCQEEKTI